MTAEEAPRRMVAGELVIVFRRRVGAVSARGKCRRPTGLRRDRWCLGFGVLLFIPYRYMENRILQAIKDAGYADVTLEQARVFQRIAPGGSRLTDLAEQAQM